MDLVNLIPSFGNLLFTVIAFVVALSVIVAVHEYGHYIVGRWCGIKAEVFSLGFGPVLWSRFDKRGTKWQIAALPFGGFVKFLGDANAASDKASDEFEQMDAETRRHTMHGAPLWARVFTVAAGPVFNFILSILVFGAFALFNGISSEPPIVEDIQPLPAEYGSLEVGDRIISVGGIPISSVDELANTARSLESSPTKEYQVIRDGVEETVTGPFPFPALVGRVTEGNPADLAGIREGDVIISIDGDAIYNFYDLQRIARESEGRALTIEIWRDGAIETVTLKTIKETIPSEDGLAEHWVIGMSPSLPFQPGVETPGLLRMLEFGAGQTYYIIQSSLDGLYKMIVGAIDECNLRGAIGIAETSGDAARQGTQAFIWFIAVLSTAVGLLNLFPIPVLDGGHLVFHAYEAATGKPPSDRALNILMTVGLAMLLMLMAFALSNDVRAMLGLC